MPLKLSLNCLEHPGGIFDSQVFVTTAGGLLRLLLKTHVMYGARLMAVPNIL